MKSNLLYFCAALIILGAFLCSGCTRNSGPVSSTNLPPTISSVTHWFPVDEGYISTFEEFSGDGSIHTTTFKIGPQVTFVNGKATQWFVLNGSGSVDTNYVVATDSAVYVYEDPMSVAERILCMPLVPGATWKRYPQYDDSGRDTTSISTGLGDILNPGGGGGAAKIVPTAGSNTMKVECTEDIILRSGSSFTGTLKVVNQNDNGTTNEYWFASGYGLVKYLIGTTSTHLNWQKSGELVSYAR